MFRRIITAIVVVLFTGCITPGQPAPTPAEQVRLAVDITACEASSVLPGVADTVDSLLGDAETATKVLRGVVGLGDALAKSYACYLRNRATVRTQEGAADAGELARRPDKEVIQARAKLCSLGGRCVRPEAAAASVLVRLGLVPGA